MNPKGLSIGAAVITAAGSSTRFDLQNNNLQKNIDSWPIDSTQETEDRSRSINEQSKVKKEFLELGGESVLSKAVRPFVESELIHYIIITYPKGQKKEAYNSLLFFKSLFSEVIRFVPGGQSRQDSVNKGLKSLSHFSPDIVLIHDGARPWISLELIERVFRMAEIYGAALPVVPEIDAMKRMDEEGIIQKHFEKNELAGAQTPQGFKFNDILKAHQRGENSTINFPDDGSLYAHFIGPVHTVPGELINRKITYSYDI